MTPPKYLVFKRFLFLTRIKSPCPHSLAPLYSYFFAYLRYGRPRYQIAIAYSIHLKKQRTITKRPCFGKHFLNITLTPEMTLRFGQSEMVIAKYRSQMPKKIG